MFSLWLDLQDLYLKIFRQVHLTEHCSVFVVLFITSAFYLQVVEYGLFVKHYKVEVYLLELKLCESSDPDNVISCHFSKADTVGK